MELKGLSSVPNVIRPMNRISESILELKDLSQQGSKQLAKESQEQFGNRIKERVEAVNEFLVPLNSSIKFTFHEELQEYYVELIDKDTQEVIREIPPKKFLDMYAAMAEFMGLFVDKKG
ncbi:flagellar protein FlaG [Pueribacillus sp. YX66]|uniref:flagellar protein FlaG n=1 Tax=Pueribacillus sp. YX66 TaxID=3229242 RepID=UPI00358D86D4